MLIGYARVSTLDQNPELQQDALNAAGCKKVFTDKNSGSSKQRPELDKLKQQLREGDTLVVWRLDRLGRSLKDLIEWISYFEAQGISFRSLQESIDTTTSTGKLIFHVFGALAEFERNLIRERTNAGLEAARARGRKGGRAKSLNARELKRAVELYNKREVSVKKFVRCSRFLNRPYIAI